jgi:hypothetical protein
MYEQSPTLKNGRELVDIQGMIEAVDKALEEQRAARRSEQWSGSPIRFEGST